MINPLAVIFEQVRVWVLANRNRGNAPDRRRGRRRLRSACCRRRPSSSAVCVFGVWIFNRDAPRIAEDL